MLTQHVQPGCNHCQNDLAAFIDCEAEVDTSTALQQFPHVWWHLLTCATCTTTYRMTRTLLDAEHQGTLLALPAKQKTGATFPAILMTLRLTRAFLSYALPRSPQMLGAARGALDGMVLIDQDTDAAGNLSLCVREQPDGCWIVSMTVTPPLDGWLLLTMGEVILRARFNSAGTAIVNDVPASLLTDAHGPDLVFDIEANTAMVDEPV